MSIVRTATSLPQDPRALYQYIHAFAFGLFLIDKGRSTMASMMVLAQESFTPEPAAELLRNVTKLTRFRLPVPGQMSRGPASPVPIAAGETTPALLPRSAAHSTGVGG